MINWFWRPFKRVKTPAFNPTAGLPKTSYGQKDSPNFDNATWFSTVQPPKKEKSPMRKLFLILLTTLLVNAMPLQAAYAQADDEKNQACSLSYKDAITDEVRKTVKEQGGFIEEIEGVRAKAFQERTEVLVEKKAPFTADRIVLVTPNAEEGTDVNVGFFVDGCLKAILHLPPEVVGALSSPLEKKPGERVD